MRKGYSPVINNGGTGGRHVMMAYNDPPRIGGSDIMGMLKRRCVGGRVHGETPFHHLGHQIERQKINKHEIHHSLRQPLINNGSHINQPKTGSPDGEKYGGKVRRAGRVGEAQYLILGAL